MNLEPLHEKLNREHPRFASHLTFEERDAIARTIIQSIGDVAPDVPAAGEPVAPHPDTKRWHGRHGDWIAPQHHCPTCGGSLAWEETDDALDIPVLAGRCRPCHTSIFVYFHDTASQEGK